MSDEITRVEILVRDRDVGRLQRLLAGIALEQPKSQPVVNASVGTNGVHAKTRGTICDMFREFLITSKVASVTPKDIKAWAQSIGRNPQSAHGYAIKCGITGGYLKRVGKGKGVKYDVLLTPSGKKKTRK